MERGGSLFVEEMERGGGEKVVKWGNGEGGRGEGEKVVKWGNGEGGRGGIL